MTIDERLDRLTERHEALTQSLELLTHDVRDLTREWDRRFGQIATSLVSLVRIAEVHQHRLDSLEGA